MNEKTLWTKLRPGLAAFGHFERIENMVGTGTPDVDFCVAGTHGKIELKYVKSYPKKHDTPIMSHGGLRTEQVAWMLNRLRNGGRIFTLVGIGTPTGTDLWLFRMDENNVRELNSYGMRIYQHQACWWYEARQVLDYKALIAVLLAPV
jgi:hypothetical protein